MSEKKQGQGKSNKKVLQCQRVSGRRASAGNVNAVLQRGATQVSDSAAICDSNFPSGLHSATALASSSAVKSAPADIALEPLRLICRMPTTRPSVRIGADMIF